MIVRFACGHMADIDPDAEQANVKCPTCAEARVSRVMAPNPTVRGACSSPLKR
jgi:hypothetical protein